MPEQSHYPCAMDCYILVARHGNPPSPDQEPMQTIVVASKEDADTAIREFKAQYPNSWCVERPLDWR